MAVACAAAFGLSACGEGTTENKVTGKQATYYKFNTQAQLVVFDDFSDESRLNAMYSLNGEVQSFLDELENSLSTAVTDSCVYRFNQAAAGETVEIDKTTYDVLSLAQSVYELTEGYYNPAVYYCVDLYGFTPNAELSDYPRISEDSLLPTQEYVTAFCDLATHFSDVEVREEDGVYTAFKPADATVTVGGKQYTLKIDLGGIGKGYAADVVDGLMQKYGFTYGFFNFGSSSMTIKARYSDGEGVPYDLQFLDPRSLFGTSYAQTTAKNVLLSTSGDYEKYFEEGGLRYCHIIDPTTGSPIRTGIASCTVIGGTAAENDALTTALSAMGKQRAVEFINQKLSDRKVVFTCENGDGALDIITNRPQEVVVLNTNYKLANTVDENGKIILN